MDLTQFNQGKPIEAGMDERKDIDFTPLKPGTYELKCISEEQFEAGVSHGVTLQFAEKVSNKYIWLRLFFHSDKAIDFSNKVISNMGNAIGLNSIKDTEAFLNKSFKADVDVETYNGKERNLVKPFSFKAVETSADHVDPKDVLGDDDIPF